MALEQMFDLERFVTEPFPSTEIEVLSRLSIFPNVLMTSLITCCESCGCAWKEHNVYIGQNPQGKCRRCSNCEKYEAEK